MKVRFRAFAILKSGKRHGVLVMMRRETCSANPIVVLGIVRRILEWWYFRDCNDVGVASDIVDV